VPTALDYPKAPTPIWRGHYRLIRLRSHRGVQQVANRPHAIRDAECDGGRGAQAFMHAAEIVVRDIQAHGCTVLL